MRIVFLGTSAGIPTPARNVTGLALQCTGGGEWILVDCGEGTQRRMARTPVSLARVRKVFLTHLHADHVLGLPGLLATRGMLSYPDPVDIFGPEGTREFLESVLAHTRTHLPFPCQVHQVEEGVVYRDARLTVTGAPLAHTTPCVGYRFQEAPKPGRLLVEKLESLGIPRGPLWGRLQRGESVVLPDGTVVDAAQVCGPPRPGASVTICLDTTPCASAVALAQGAGVLIHEATFGEAHRHVAAENGHSTASQAASVALRAGVGRLVLTHLSPRYHGEEGVRTLEEEARAVFPASSVAADLEVVEV